MPESHWCKGGAKVRHGFCFCAGAMRTRASFDSPPSAFDFSAFVASGRGISSQEAEQLIEHWLAAYEPRARRRGSVEREPAAADAEQFRPA
jgi:hypothetical protein